MVYRLKLAENKSEIKKAQELRTKKFDLTRFDSDIFDDYCDHLMLYQDNALIGTMRLRQSKSSKHPFYSSQEFKLNGFEKRLLNHNFIEAGRICTIEGSSFLAPIMLLTGEFKYAQSRNIENFIGCTSFYTENLQDAEDIFIYLEKGGFTASKNNLIKTKDYYKMDFNPSTPINENPHIESLAKLYLDFGAKIISEPALDKEFHCIDYLMAGNVKKIPDKFKRIFSQALNKMEIDDIILKKTLAPVWKERKKFPPLPKIKPLLKHNQKRFQKRYELSA